MFLILISLSEPSGYYLHYFVPFTTHKVYIVPTESSYVFVEFKEQIFTYVALLDWFYECHG
jgi:hypothetical protein